MPAGKPFTPEEIEKINSMPMNFVLGKERSGTTLLQLMLNVHPGIVAPPESRFIMLLFYKYGRIKQWTEKIIINFCNDLFKEALFRNFWSVIREELQADLLASKDLLTFPLVCKIIFRISAPGKEDVHIFFDKNPLYYYFLPELNSIFPEAKYIHLVRDYRANLVSHRRVFTVEKATDIAYRWMKVNMLIEDAKKRSPQNYFTLTYESLVSNPGKNMEDVCRFLNLPYDKNMAENHQAGMYAKFNSNSKGRFLKVHQNVFNEINLKHVSEWEEKLVGDELIKVEAIAGEFGRVNYGYKLKSPQKRIQRSSLFTTDLKYRIIKAIYRTAFAHNWLYYKIKRYVWRNF